MSLRKFCGATSRSVLQQVRAEMGADAFIVSNRSTPDGIEISAMAGDAIETLLAPRSAGSPPPPSPKPAPAADVVATPETAPAVKRWYPRHDETPPEPAVAPDRDADRTIRERLVEEVAAMRSLLEGQLAQLAWTDTMRRYPVRARLTRDLLASGYSAALARRITQRLPDDCTEAQAQPWLTAKIAKHLRCQTEDEDPVHSGGVYALIGPTGVGKTTTTAKLAARAAVRYGASKITLLTTDNYRVGAQDQLRIYAKILGVSVHAVSDGDDLRQALDSLRSKHLVLIDTVGMSQRDERVAEQAMLLGQPEVKRILLLNASSQPETLEEVVAAYRGPGERAGGGLAGCVITKLDEAARSGAVLDAIIRHQLTLHYVSNGQRVPEDLHAANASYLVHRSLKPAPKTSPFALQDDELAMTLADTAGLAHV